MAEPFNVERIMEVIGRNLINEVDGLALLLMEKFQIFAPVDTGHFRRNFQLSVGVPITYEVPGVDKESSSTYNNAVAKLTIAASRNPFLPVFITDNVPYANALAEGHSLQAQAGWVEDNIEDAILERAGGLGTGIFSLEEF